MPTPRTPRTPTTPTTPRTPKTPRTPTTPRTPRTPRTPTNFNLINELPAELLNLSLNKIDANDLIKVLLAEKTLSVPDKKRNVPTVYLYNTKITNRFIDILIKLLSNTNITTLKLYGKLSFEKDFDFSILDRSKLFANVKTLEIGNMRINNAINRFLASCGCSPATVKLDNITFNSRTDVDIKDFVKNLRRFNEIDLEVSNIDDKHAFINEIKELRKTSSVIKTLKIDGAMTAVFSLSRKVLRRSSSSSS